MSDLAHPSDIAVVSVLDDIPTIDGAVVTAPDGTVLASSSPLLCDLSRLQLTSGTGPTSEAMSGRTSRINYLMEAPTPEFRQFCQAGMIRSVLAVPVGPRHDVVAALTVTSSDHHAFGATEIRGVLSIARELADRLGPRSPTMRNDEDAAITPT